MQIKRDWLKFTIGWAVCFVIRTIPFRPPNMEPILTTTMPFSKNYGWKATFLFSFLSIVIYDVFTQKTGSWTFITGACYGFLGLLSYLYFKNRRNNRLNYLAFAVAGTVLYDALTGLTIGPLLFGMSFTQALVGQIPFTINHLLSNMVLSVTLSPIIYKWVVSNDALIIKLSVAKNTNN